jgi:hypothetical protein
VRVPDPYVSRVARDPERPQTLVVCCSDGRFHAPIADFVDHLVSDRADLLALPGGPAVLDPWNSSFDEARVFEQSLRLFLAHHDLRHACLIAHDGCSYYREKHPGLSARELLERQVADLRRGAALLRERAPGLAVRLVLARLGEGRVRFEGIDPEPPSDTLTGP